MHLASRERRWFQQQMPREFTLQLLHTHTQRPHRTCDLNLYQSTPTCKDPVLLAPLLEQRVAAAPPLLRRDTRALHHTH